MTDATTSSIEHHLAALERDGFSVAAHALAPDLVDDICTEIDAMADTWGRSLVQSFHGHRTVRYFDLLNGGDVWQRLPAHAAILPVVRAVLGDDCLLSTYGTVAIGPGEPAQAIHADDVLYRMRRPHPDIFCNVMIALDDFTDANGATRMVPGSHRWPDDPAIRIPAGGEVETRWRSVPAEMPRGSVCFFLGGTYHGGGANRTDAPRRGITMAYCAGWLRPQENFVAAVAQDRCARWDDDLLRVMGWGTAHGGALGCTYTHPRHLTGPVAHRLVSRQAPQVDLTGGSPP